MIRIKVYYINKPVFNKNDITQLEFFTIQKKSLLKGGLRGILLNDPKDFLDKDWFKKYENKENVEFYIDKSGIYRLSNVDLEEGELYFEKSITPAYSKKCIFLDMPFEDKFKNGILAKLKERFEDRIEIGTIAEYAKGKGAVKLDDEIFKVIRHSLLFIADITPIANRSSENRIKWLSNSNVMIELGYALAVKNHSNILITFDKDSQEVENITDTIPNDSNNKKTKRNKNKIMKTRSKTTMNPPFDIQSFQHETYSSKSPNGFIDIFKEVDKMLNKFNL